MLTAKARKRRRNKRQHDRVVKKRCLLLEGLEDRRLLAADFQWAGDVLEINGSSDSDFIAVQQDAAGVKVFTDDAVHTSHNGRAFDTAASISLAGGEGHDILFSYGAAAPVSLAGDAGNDFLFSDKAADTLDGGDGFDWLYGQQEQELWENAFGVPGLDLANAKLDGTPQFDADNRIGLSVEVEGEADLAGEPVDVVGLANVATDGVSIEVTGTSAAWTNAFGIAGFDLSNTSLTVQAGTDVNGGDGYQVGLASTLDINGTEVGIDGSVGVAGEATSAQFTGSVTSWENAFGVPEFDLQAVELVGSGTVDGDGVTALSIAVSGEMDVEGTDVDVAGSVGISPELIQGEFSGSVANWEDAFGVTGLALANSELNVAAFTDRDEDYGVSVEVNGDLLVEETSIGIEGRVDIAPDRVDAALLGEVQDWDNAFGVDGLNLNAVRMSVAAATDRGDVTDLMFHVDGDMDVDGTDVGVSGTVEVSPERSRVSLNGSVAGTWTEAFGIEALTLKQTQVQVDAARTDAGSSLAVDVRADMEFPGKDVAVAGRVGITPGSVSGSLIGSVPGEWSDAVGVVGLNLTDTTLGVSASKSAAGSQVSAGVQAGLSLLGEDIKVGGSISLASGGVGASFTGSVPGEWVDVFGVEGLQLKDAELRVSADTDPASEAPLSVSLDTGLQLFGGYIDVSGALEVNEEGFNVSFSPPGSLEFNELLGIPGFTLENADVEVSAGTDGIEASVSATMEMSGQDVDFAGAFSIGKSEVQASMTGRVASWDNAFDVAGLNLEDVVMTLGAESGAGGASMYIGLGAGIHIGAKELDVAGLVGFGVTGWDVAFRGSINSLTSDDLIDFANTITQAADPDSPEIPADALGEFEIRDAYVNFAPKGGDEALGIDDGFGIGGEFYEDGKRLADGELAVDLEQGSFQVALDVPYVDLGPVELSDVVVDIRIAPLDSHYRIAGTAELMGSDVRLEGELNADGTFALSGNGNINIDGLAASAVFHVDNSGASFVATASGAAVDGIKGAATASLIAVANDAKALIAQAQAALDQARAEVNSLKAELADAREAAQAEIDKIKADLAAAQIVVDKAASAKSYWYRVRRSRYSAWRSAVAATNRAPWWQKPYYKSIEASKYASYQHSVGVYAAKVVEYDIAVTAYNAVRAAAGWALDAAGVDANPEVIRLTASLAVANTAVTLAEEALDAVERANADALRLLDVADSLRVNRITLSGSVANYLDAGVGVEIDYSFMGATQRLSLEASTEGLVDQLARDLAAEIL